MPDSQTTLQSVSASLNRVLFGIVGAVVAVSLVLGYFSAVQLLEHQSLLLLEELVAGHSLSESPRFTQAQDNVLRIKQELLRRIEQQDPIDAEQKFMQRFAKSNDQLWRVKPEIDDHLRLPSLYLHGDANLSASLYTRAIVSYDLLAERGPAIVPPYYSVFMDFVEMGLMVYSPHTNWGAGATHKTNNHHYPTMVGADPIQNPTRKRFWTPAYYNEEAKIWMVSVVEPLDWRGKWVGTVGHDVSIDSVIDHSLAAGFDESYEMLLSNDGSLIAHPHFTQQIEAAKNDSSMMGVADPEIDRISSMVVGLSVYPAVVVDPDAPYYYGVARINGPNWLLVTVYPKEILTQRALVALIYPVLVVLLLLTAAMYMLRRMVARIVTEPLKHLDFAVEELASGDATANIPIIENNEFGRLARSFEDLSKRLNERERSLLEARNDWRRMFNAVPEMISIVDLELQLLQFNDAFLGVYSLSSEEVLGTNRISLFSDVSQPLFQNAYNKVITEGKTQYLNTFSQRTHSNYEITLVPLFSNDSLAAIGEIARDVTEQRRLEDQLRQSQKMEAIGQLAGGVAHDFNNLLQIVLGYAETIESEPKQSTQNIESAKRIVNAGNKAAALTQQLLAFSRRQMMQSRVVELDGVVEETLILVERLIESNVKVTFDRHDKPLKVFADSNQLVQVLLNMCVNSRDAMPQGGHLNIKVSATASLDQIDELTTKENGYACITVTDSGSGIDKSILNNVFEPFFSTKDKHKGTGLGLATAYGIIQQHGGTITASSIHGQGASFSVYLPLVVGAVDEKQSNLVSVGTQKGSACVLLADDDAQIRELVSRILDGAGYKVLQAADGTDALRVYEEHADEIDFLILDLMMPELNGHQVMSEIRLSNPEMPCLLASGYSEDSQREGFVKDAITGFVSKPFSRHQLLHEVQRLLGSESTGKPQQK